jgi:hypothetical protein
LRLVSGTWAGRPRNKARSCRVGGNRRLSGPRPMTYRANLRPPVAACREHLFTGRGATEARSQGAPTRDRPRLDGPAHPSMRLWITAVK